MYPNIDLIYILKTLEMNLKDLRIKNFYLLTQTKTMIPIPKKPIGHGVIKNQKLQLILLEWKFYLHR